VVQVIVSFSPKNTSDNVLCKGLISRELAAYTKSIVGVDISQAMIDQFNIRVENQGIPADEMKGVCAELKGLDEELDGTKFDVVVVSSVIVADIFLFDLF
jgi:2-polyprenyl-3-methyl-5-hydroxy-6-metoxy-1,4-benzoquinol methylase